MFSFLLCFRSVIGRMSLAEGQERAPERAGARAKSRSRGLADIDPKFISQVRKFARISNNQGSSLPPFF